MNAAFTHFWDPAWKSTLWGSYRAVSYNTNANAMLCSAIGRRHRQRALRCRQAGCDMDWSAWGGGLRTEWAVSHRSFQIGLEVMYAKLNARRHRAGTIALGRQRHQAGGDLHVSDQDIWAVRLRVNRNFYP